MADDVPSTGDDAAINLRDDNRRVSRERHKRLLLESALDSTKICLFPQDTTTKINGLYQCLNVIDNVTSDINKSCNKSNNQKVIVVVDDSLSFTPSSDNDNNDDDDDDCQDIKTKNNVEENDDDNKLQLSNKEDNDDDVNNRLLNVSHSVESTNVTLLTTSWTSMSTIDPLGVNVVNGSSLMTLGLVESVNKTGRSERIVKERSATIKSMGKSGCIKSNKKKIEKMISAIVRSESREVGKDNKQEDVAKDKKGLSQGRVITTRLQDTSFKKQIKSSEDTLIGPCGKKRCADRYDSSESSDSGVTVSYGESSSSGTSDITEPGSPCSTSSDEGLGIRAASARLTLPSLACKMPPSAPVLPNDSRPQWPWTPSLAKTACTTFKRLKAEPEIVTSSTRVESSSRQVTKTTNKSLHQESQGKITEYFKTQVKPQQQKTKKTTEMSVHVTKNSTEFRHPSTVQRNNKSGLSKYLSNNKRTTNVKDWNVRSLTIPTSTTKKSPLVLLPRSIVKLERKLPKSIPTLPVTNNDIISTLPNSKISSLRLNSDSNSVMEKGNGTSLKSSSSSDDNSESTTSFKNNIICINENNNVSNNLLTSTTSLISQGDHLFVRNSIASNLNKKEVDVLPDEEEDDEEEDSSRDGIETKPPLSPILSAPTTIRFPAQTPDKDRSSSSGGSGFCRWDKCEAIFESSGCLLEHLQVAHINTQTGGDNFVCHWQGCKVKGRTSCSRRWLERHVMSHGGNKPFRCIVDGCGSRFSSQIALERHVNGHFNQPETSNNSNRRSFENSGKMMRRNGKRLRYRRQPWSARLFDYFDTGIMEGLQHRLLELAKSRTQGKLAETPGNSMTLTSQIIAKRVEKDGKIKFLLRWHPHGIITDEWVSETEVQGTKYVEIRKMATLCPDEINHALYPAINNDKAPQARRKHGRKPMKNS